MTIYIEALQQISDEIMAHNSFLLDDKLTPKQLKLRTDKIEKLITDNCLKSNHNYICTDPNKREWNCEYCGKGE